MDFELAGWIITWVDPKLWNAKNASYGSLDDPYQKRLHMDSLGEGHHSTGAEVQRVDRGLHPGIPQHLSADVDLQGGIR